MSFEKIYSNGCSFMWGHHHNNPWYFEFFEDTKNSHTEYYPEWLMEWVDTDGLEFVNLITKAARSSTEYSIGFPKFMGPIKSEGEFMKDISPLIKSST